MRLRGPELTPSSQNLVSRCKTEKAEPNVARLTLAILCLPRGLYGHQLLSPLTVEMKGCSAGDGTSLPDLGAKIHCSLAEGSSFIILFSDRLKLEIEPRKSASSTATNEELIGCSCITLPFLKSSGSTEDSEPQQQLNISQGHTVMAAKPLMKEALQAEVGRPQEQKGSAIPVEAIPPFIRENVQIIVLETSKKRMEKQLEQLEILYPDKARGVAKFNVPLAHMIIAGADFILVPSRFEPCGPIQLHAMRYGTVPIVASTGGPAKKWEGVLLSLGGPGGEAGIDGEKIASLAKENVATP
ncbi:hypothetical protein QUC31_005102 [Theobroma cacao]